MPATEIRRELDLDCCARTADNFLWSEGIETYHAANKPKLTQRDRHLRIDFASYYLDQIDWKRCIFADESCFSTEKNGSELVKRPTNSRYDAALFNFVDHCRRIIVSVWGAVCYHGVSPLVRMDSHLNQQTYVEILDSYGVDFVTRNFGNSGCCWIDDNCPAQRASFVDSWFDNCNALHGINLSFLRSPPYLSDVNVIENFWGDTKRELLYQEISPSSQLQMFEIISGI